MQKRNNKNLYSGNRISHLTFITFASQILLLYFQNTRMQEITGWTRFLQEILQKGEMGKGRELSLLMNM